MRIAAGRPAAACLLAAVIAAMSGCGPDAEDAAPTSSPSASAAAPSSSTTAGTAMPTVSLVTDVAGAPGAQGGSTPPSLVTIVSEQVADSGQGRVQTVECTGGMPQPGSTDTTCTVTLSSHGHTAADTWHAYRTRNPDGTPALLLLRGTPLTDEFAQLIGDEGTAMAATSIGPAYGAGDVGGAELVADTNEVLSTSRSRVRLQACEGTLSFDAFESVVCTGTHPGAPARALVLPATFLVGDPGLIVITQSGV